MAKTLIISLVVIYSLFSANEICSQIVLDRFEEYKFKPIVFAGGGFIFGASSKDFFEIFQDELEGKGDYARHSPTLHLGFKNWLSRKVRVGLSANYYNTSFFSKYYTGGEFLSRSHNHSIQVQTIPVLISAELIPYDKQFRSYIGGSLGTTISRVDWSERVSSSFPLDKRKSAVHYAETDVVPALRVFSGIELGFDEYPESKFLGSLIFEFNYTYSHRNIDIFKNIKKQLSDYSSSLDNKVAFFPGYFSFNLALSFNLLAKETPIQ